MDLKLSKDPYKSYKIFQTRVNNEYTKMLSEYNIIEIDAEKSIHQKQIYLRKLVKETLAKKGINI